MPQTIDFEEDRNLKQFKNILNIKPYVAFKLGQRDILEKLAIIFRFWIEGKESDKEFAKKLNDFLNEYVQIKKVEKK